jgi:hypothetical protein
MEVPSSSVPGIRENARECEGEVGAIELVVVGLRARDEDARAWPGRG